MIPATRPFVIKYGVYEFCLVISCTLFRSDAKKLPTYTLLQLMDQCEFSYIPMKDLERPVDHEKMSKIKEYPSTEFMTLSAKARM